MENEEFSPVVDKRKKKEKAQSAQFSTNENVEIPVANDPQVEVNDTSSAHAQTEEQVEKKPKKKLKAKHGLKPFAFFSGVFDIVVAVAIVGLGLWVSMILFNSVDTGISEDLDTLLGFFYLPFIIIIMAIAATAGVLFLIDGILSLISSFKSDRKNWNGVIVAAAVFDVLLFLPSVVLIFANGETQIAGIALTVLLVVTFIFKIIDISLTKRRLKKYQAAKEEEYKQTYHGPDFSKLDTTLHGSAPLAQESSQNDVQGENVETGTSQDTQNSGGVDFSKLK